MNMSPKFKEKQFKCWSWLFTLEVVSNVRNARISKAGIAFDNLRYLWRQKDTSLSLECRIYKSTVGAVLLYDSEV